MKILKKLGQDMRNNILFIHAILGCDTTSRLLRIGKGTSLKKFCESHHFRDQAKVFNNTSASKKEVIEAGEKALVCLYNGKSGETLDSLRYRRYCQKVDTNTSQIQPQSLPPTSAAAT
jgi:glucosamine 6-phosphate synthetase-like amidotransferase/phosphosugar isomerase protein